MNNLWVIESKHSLYEDEYSTATFDTLIPAFSTRKKAREKIKDVKDIDRMLKIKGMYYRAVRYVKLI